MGDADLPDVRERFMAGGDAGDVCGGDEEGVVVVAGVVERAACALQSSHALGLCRSSPDFIHSFIHADRLVCPHHRRHRHPRALFERRNNSLRPKHFGPSRLQQKQHGKHSDTT